MNKKILGIIGLLVLIVVSLCGCVEDEDENGYNNAEGNTEENEPYEPYNPPPNEPQTTTCPYCDGTGEIEYSYILQDEEGEIHTGFFVDDYVEVSLTISNEEPELGKFWVYVTVYDTESNTYNDENYGNIEGNSIMTITVEVDIDEGIGDCYYEYTIDAPEKTCEECDGTGEIEY